MDGGALLWVTDGWRQIEAPLAAREGATLGVAFSPDGRTLVTSHDDGAVMLWDVEARQPIGSPLPGLAKSWVTARFTPDGARLFVVSDVGRAGRSIPSSGCNGRAPSPAAASLPSSGRSSSPSRTTSRPAPSD